MAVKLRAVEPDDPHGVGYLPESEREAYVENDRDGPSLSGDVNASGPRLELVKGAVESEQERDQGDRKNLLAFERLGVMISCPCTSLLLSPCRRQTFPGWAILARGTPFGGPLTMPAATHTTSDVK